MTYTAYDGTNARGDLATSKDLRHFKKQGVIVPPITYAEFVFLAESAGKVNENYYRNHKFYYQEADPEKNPVVGQKCSFLSPKNQWKIGVPSPDQTWHSNSFCK
jgi:predicted GH43/DUF377 family glycosyl hydrolase